MKLAIPILTLVAVIALTAADSAKPSTDAYGGTTTISTEATGFFRTEEIDGRHWFITPEGNAFFPVALSHLFSGESDLAAKNVYGGD
ncbi:MAG: hypothetical protein P1U58_20980, partial [Verrucomicrobiales bacterium]|nr:hypothetical protein [Verrucomicrobiales bacterium]